MALDHDGSSYEEGATITDEGLEIWIDGNLQTLKDRSAGSYGASSAMTGTAPIRLGIYSLASDKTDLNPDITYAQETFLSGLRVCNYDLGEPSGVTLQEHLKHLMNGHQVSDHKPISFETLK